MHEAAASPAVALAAAPAAVAHASAFVPPRVDFVDSSQGHEADVTSRSMSPAVGGYASAATCVDEISRFMTSYQAERDIQSPIGPASLSPASAAVTSKPFNELTVVEQ